MTDLPLIKFACGLAPGFGWLEDEQHVVAPSGRRIFDNEYDGRKWLLEVWPLLLQSAIEGVNEKDPNNQQICQHAHGVQILSDGNRDVVMNFNFNEYPSKTATKAAALQYVMEQEGA